jgi:thiol:disulfide interchange protein
MPYKTDLTAALTIVSSPEAAGAIPLQVRKNVGLTHVAKSKTTLAPSFSASTPLKPIRELAIQPGEIPELHPRPVLPSLEVGSMVKAALFALLAGFILNFMPCVLPVVSLKVLGFVQQSQESGRRVAYMGLSFAAACSSGQLCGIRLGRTVPKAIISHNNDRAGFCHVSLSFRSFPASHTPLCHR